MDNVALDSKLNKLLAAYNEGIWRLSRSPMLQTVLNNARLKRWGLWVPSDFATVLVAGFNRRMRKTACPVVWERRRAQ